MALVSQTDSHLYVITYRIVSCTRLLYSEYVTVVKHSIIKTQ